MTAFKEYDRLEASGLWRATPQAQRRDVIIAIGEATLTITDMKDTALAHWSLAALDRINPGEVPAIYSPDGDPGETLEIAENETAMVAAIEKLRAAIEKARPRPGRLRHVSVVAILATAAAILVFWLPGAMVQHTVGVVPTVKRQAIGEAILGRIERVGGRACISADAAPALARLARRTGVRKLVVLRAGVTDSRALPGGIVLINASLLENFEDPAVVAGFILAERVRVASADPLARMLADAGPVASFQLLTTGDVTQATLDGYAERFTTVSGPPASTEALLDAFGTAGIPTTPYAYALDSSGETVLALIEADPMAGQTPDPVLRDRDWVVLQSICG